MDENNTDEHISDVENADENEITEDEAENIIRSCGQQTPHLWPKSFRAYTAELYCEEKSVLTDLIGERTLLADMVFGDCWAYHEGEAVFAGGAELRGC